MKKFLHVLFNFRKFYDAVEVSWYAMHKFSPKECQREIQNCNSLLLKK